MLYRNILINLQDLEDARPVLAKAAALCKSEPDQSHLQVIRVVYDGLADLKSKHIDASIELKKFVLEAEEPLLEDAIRLAGLTSLNIESSTVWHKHIWEGVLHAAQADRTDLILKPRSDTRPSFYPHPPEDWNLIRHARVPVLLTRTKAWPINPTVLAAVDVYDEAHNALNRAVLSHANRLATGITGNLHVVSVFPVLSAWINEVATAKNYERLRDDMTQESRAAINTLCQDLDIDGVSIHTTEGETDTVLEKLVKSTKTCVLVIGTKARTGLSGLLIGNTAEKILSRVDTDVMTIPLLDDTSVR
ncbi:MAG: universal stress protein [bacterium]